METVFKKDGGIYSRGELALSYSAGDKVTILEALKNDTFKVVITSGHAKGTTMYAEKDLLSHVPAPVYTKPEIIEVYIDYRQHATAPAMVQQFVNALTGDVVLPHKLGDHTLESVFTDSCGRKVLVFKK